MPQSPDIFLRIVSTTVPGRAAGETFPLADSPITLGRADDCGVALKDGSVSRKHAVVEPVAGGGYRLRDTGSANGVYVGDARTPELVLTHQAQFRIGDTVFEFVAPPPPPPPPPPKKTPFIIRIVASKAGDATERELSVSGVVSIGRAEECTIPIKDLSASKRHAVVTADGDGFRVIDNGSANGVWLEDQRVSDEVLKPGQRFRVGDTFFECYPKPEEGDGDEGRPLGVAVGRVTVKGAS